MNLLALARSIKARIISDNGPGGLFEPGVGLLYDDTRAGQSRFRRNYTTDVEPTVLRGKPVVVWRIEDVPDAGSTMDSDEFEANVVFDIFGNPPLLEGDVGDEDIHTIADRLFGDATAQPTRIPSFGLHRHTLDSTNWNGWTNGQVWRTGFSEGFTEKLITATITFKVSYGRQKPPI